MEFIEGSHGWMHLADWLVDYLPMGRQNSQHLLHVEVCFPINELFVISVLKYKEGATVEY